jgi:hypothetical protein
MPRAVVVAAGDLDALPAEASEVANTLSSAGWTVRLCVGAEASRAGLLAAAGDGDAQLAWLGVHSGTDGCALADGDISPAQLGVWLRNVSARDCVLNSCYSVEHVDAIQRAADVDVACTVAPGGVDSTEAWQWGVYAVRAYVANGGDLQQAVRQASGFGALQYRFIPCGGVKLRGRVGRMPPDRIEEQLASLLRAVRGDTENGTPGLAQQMRDLQAMLLVMQNEQRAWRDSVDTRLRALEGSRPVAVSARSAAFVMLITVIVMALILVGVMLLNRAGA